MTTSEARPPEAALRTTGPGRLAVRARGVSKSFNGRAILSGFDLTLVPNEFVALLGASGSGKTTFLRILAGLESADGGQVLAPKRRTVVLLVTHDVDEAILLADRVVVLQEGRVGTEYPVEFPRPRRRGVPGFGDFRRRLLLDLGVEESIGAGQSG